MSDGRLGRVPSPGNQEITLAAESAGSVGRGERNVAIARKNSQILLLTGSRTVAIRTI